MRLRGLRGKAKARQRCRAFCWVWVAKVVTPDDWRGVNAGREFEGCNNFHASWPMALLFLQVTDSPAFQATTKRIQIQGILGGNAALQRSNSS